MDSKLREAIVEAFKHYSEFEKITDYIENTDEYREYIYDKIDEYGDVVIGAPGIECYISKIISMSENYFTVMHSGWESDFEQSYPIALLLDDDYLTNIKKENELAKKQREKTLNAQKDTEEYETYLKLKSKFE